MSRRGSCPGERGVAATRHGGRWPGTPQGYDARARSASRGPTLRHTAVKSICAIREVSVMQWNTKLAPHAVTKPEIAAPYFAADANCHENTTAATTIRLDSMVIT